MAQIGSGNFDDTKVIGRDVTDTDAEEGFHSGGGADLEVTFDRALHEFVVGCWTQIERDGLPRGVEQSSIPIEDIYQELDLAIAATVRLQAERQFTGESNVVHIVAAKGALRRHTCIQGVAWGNRILGCGGGSKHPRLKEQGLRRRCSTTR